MSNVIFRYHFYVHFDCGLMVMVYKKIKEIKKLGKI